MDNRRTDVLENPLWKVQIGEMLTGGEVLPITVTYKSHGAVQEETFAGFLISKDGIASLEESLEEEE